VADRYAEPWRVFAVTLCLEDRQRHFAQPVFARHCIDFLKALALLTGTRVHAYCLMPDHACLLIGPSPSTSLPGFVGRWRSLCAREWYRRTGSNSFWRPSFRDHALADDEDLLRAVERILAIPVRAGLADAPHAYAFSGSLEWDVGSPERAGAPLRAAPQPAPPGGKESL
jgi:REP element-mobilizing transposase RayT